MKFSKKDEWLDMDEHIDRLNAVERELIEKMEHLQDPVVITRFQNNLNKISVAKLEWHKLKVRMSD